MDLSIVTPSFNMLHYLRRCAASVDDQIGVEHEHIVVDAVSSDGTVEWLRGAAQHVTSIVEQDRGMYDAINKGLRQASGEIVAYLNCDEQYLPGTFQFVKRYFEEHPEVDGIFGDVLLIRPNGSLIAFIKSYPPVWSLILSHDLYVYPSSMFLRRRVIDDGEFFDTAFRDVGDMEFVVRLLRKGYTLKAVRGYVSAFTITGSNRSQQPAVREERLKLREAYPAWVRFLQQPLNLTRLAVKLLSGAYFETPPLTYRVYLDDGMEDRHQFVARQLSPRFRLA